MGQSGKFVEFDEPSAPNAKGLQRRSKFSDAHNEGPFSSMDKGLSDDSGKRQLSKTSSSKLLVPGESQGRSIFQTKAEASSQKNEGASSVFKRKAGPAVSQTDLKKTALSSFELIKQKFIGQQVSREAQADAVASFGGATQPVKSAKTDFATEDADPLDQFMN